MAPASAPTATTSYFICFTVRSGSTYLCDLLTGTGLAGQPGEHFYHEIGPDAPTGVPVTDYAAYIRQTVARTTTPNGVFGAKIDGATWHDFVRRLRSIPASQDAPLPDALATFFPDLRYIWLTRRNKVRQAVSHWMAIQTGRWHAPDAPSPAAPEYTYDAIDHLLQDIVIRDAVWAEYFAAHDIQPLCIVYEDFVARPAATLRAVLTHLGIDAPAGLALPASRHTRLANALSEEWVQRFRAEKQRGWWAQFW